jgi:hypothetical protein
MDDCIYKNDIEVLKKDRTVLQEQFKAIKEDTTEIRADVKELIYNGIIDKKVESALARLFFRFVLAAIGSGGAVAAFVSWLASRGGS